MKCQKCQIVKCSKKLRVVCREFCVIEIEWTMKISPWRFQKQNSRNGNCDNIFQLSVINITIVKKENPFKKLYTYNVWIFFKASNVPLANDCMLLSYSDSKLKPLKSLNASLRTHVISLAFNNNSWSEKSPLKTPAGSSLILLP